MDKKLLEKLLALREKHIDLNKEMQKPEVMNDHTAIARIAKAISDLDPLLPILEKYESCQAAIEFAKEKHDDKEMAEMAQMEAEEAKITMEELTEELKIFLIPKDKDDAKSVILEVRAGTGGEEAALFGAELVKMYLRYCEIKGWGTEVLDIKESDNGGVKAASVKINGQDVYGSLKFESGTHRVQRIPATESKGRLHTSAATVAILPEAKAVDIELKMEDVRVDTYRASGAGGQHVNKTDSAVRMVHEPTGVTVECQVSRSQQKNREMAVEMLRSRLYAAEQERLAKERGEARAGQVGSGDRSEKIRTYNFPQDRVTDHRIGQNFSNLPGIMTGEIQSIIEALQTWDQAQRLASIEAE